MPLSATQLQFDSAPAILPIFAKAALASGGLSDGQTIPRIEATLAPTPIDARALAKYSKVCGFARGWHLPITYPFALAFPLHLSLLTHETFPLKLLGLVHMRNRIEQLRQIPVDAAPEISAWVEGHREVRLGVEFDLHTEAWLDGEVVWRAVASNLSRTKNPPRGDKPAQPEPPEFDQHTYWKAPSNIGRRYGRVAGDVNPIHMSMLSAKLFGFKRAIAHGMWSKARTAAALDAFAANDQVAMEVAFRKPVFLPSKVRLDYKRTDDDGVVFHLHNSKGDIVHMTGTISPIAG